MTFTLRNSTSSKKIRSHDLSTLISILKLLWPILPSQQNGQRTQASYKTNVSAVLGKLAPSSKADMAFVQHMLHQLDEQGTMAVVLPHGVLFRGSSEGVIRQYLIEKMNVVDTIIGLPANIFYGTSIPTCILVLKKNGTHTGDILFIDASNDFESRRTKTSYCLSIPIRSLQLLNSVKIFEKYAKVATLQEVKDNDYNLNIPRYVDTFEAEDEIDLNRIAQQLKDLEAAKPEN